MGEVQKLFQLVEAHSAELDNLSMEVWKNPELAFNEFTACKLQCDLLKKWGFEVTENYCGFETAYRCEYGSGTPAFAITSEYDALPAIGHGCGHNLICGASLGAFIALTEYMKANNIPGKVILLGTPAEESGSSKVKIVDSGALDNVDAAMMVHPLWRTTLDTGCLSIKRFDVVFKGKAAHASGSPHLGINALDAVQLLFAGVNAWRQQLPESSRIHGIVTEGGLKPNITPERAGCCFFVRSATQEWQDKMNDRFHDIVKGAALMTGCEYEIRPFNVGTMARKPNSLMNQVWMESIGELGSPVDLSFGPGRGSTDFGNVSQVVPGIHPYIGISEDHTEIAGHSVALCEAAGKPYALSQMHKASAAMAAVGLKVLTDETYRGRLKEEFNR